VAALIRPNSVYPLQPPAAEGEIQTKARNADTQCRLWQTERALGQWRKWKGPGGTPGSFKYADAWVERTASGTFGMMLGREMSDHGTRLSAPTAMAQPTKRSLYLAVLGRGTKADEPNRARRRQASNRSQNSTRPTRRRTLGSRETSRVEARGAKKQVPRRYHRASACTPHISRMIRSPLSLGTILFKGRAPSVYSELPSRNTNGRCVCGAAPAAHR
jgi:hypothetical protein